MLPRHYFNVIHVVNKQGKYLLLQVYVKMALNIEIPLTHMVVGTKIEECKLPQKSHFTTPIISRSW